MAKTAKPKAEKTVLSIRALNRERIKGKVWIGDPCYVFGDNAWNEFMAVQWADRKNPNKPTVDDHNGAVLETVHGPAYLCGTAYGDGFYDVRVNGESVGGCGVDAGLLSVIPLATVKKLVKDKKRGGAGNGRDNLALGLILAVDGKFEANGGDFSVGNLSVNTSGEGEEEEESDSAMKDFLDDPLGQDDEDE
jgi:hypothetical protein